MTAQDAAPSDLVLARLMSLHPKVIDLTLDRVWRLLAALDHPERALPPAIHLAGTNGKGSTLAFLRAGIEGAGQRAHAYTSPHLARFHERIRLAGELIPEAELTAVLDECEAANGGAPITYFEITTCAALLAFSRRPAEWTLLETGLGGRLDATNVLDAPELTIITPVAMDHEQFLGDTLEKIAFEKAGILKRGTPCIVGPQEDAAREVIARQAARTGAPLLIHGEHWHVGEERGRMVFQDERGLLDLPRPALPGAHQLANAGAAVAALRHLGFGEDACAAAVARAEWPARMQRLRRGPLAEAAPEAELWLDGGHNPAAGAALAAHLKSLPARPTHLICGMLSTKDATGYLAPLAEAAESFTAVPIAGEPAALDPEALAATAEAAGHRARTATGPAEALAAITAETPAARVLICGSLYLAGQILRETG
ncbi:bifunctional folylpolyglutamate synthase/dihydrofolate synthase [Rhodosalinus sediminis]|uniref:bifunctional folylpolyglutamate synthase/dihydrofolate synthase n=1 Tax=Rhodosalinus sediminis TaxID=1940533 RepID=UPI00235521F9|nr:folylpolyglutamate synthase/dihydrofolate synthase family protein [Rhodosalinus sediminis]